MNKIISVLLIGIFIASCNSSMETKEAALDSVAAVSDTAWKITYDERFPPDTSGVRSDTMSMLEFKIHLRSHINYITNQLSSINESTLETSDRKKLYRSLRSTLVSVYAELSNHINISLLNIVTQHTKSLAIINGKLEEKNDSLKNYANQVEKIANILGFFADAAGNLIGLKTIPVATSITQ